jgi:hypothetical protein
MRRYNETIKRDLRAGSDEELETVSSIILLKPAASGLQQVFE